MAVVLFDFLPLSSGVCLQVSAAVLMMRKGEVVSIWQNLISSLAAEELSGITDIGHSAYNFFYFFMERLWEAASSKYVIAENVDCNKLCEMLQKRLYPSLVLLCCAWCRVLLWLFKAWITDRCDHFQVLNMLLLYRSSKKVQNKILFSTVHASLHPLFDKEDALLLKDMFRQKSASHTKRLKKYQKITFRQACRARVHLPANGGIALFLMLY